MSMSHSTRRRTRAPQSRASAANRIDAAASPVVESLEERRLMSFTLSSGVLTVNGTEADDIITVGKNSLGQLALYENNALTAAFDWASVGKIVVNAKGGNDKVTITATTDKPAQVDAGAGNDTVNGGAANDSLYGGAGNDLLQGNGGDDHIEDGAGRDRANGGAGNDEFVVPNESLPEPDEYFGNAGLDMISYGIRPARVRISVDDLANDGLADGTSGPGPEMDNVHSDIEIASGTNYNDSFYGNDLANYFYGGAGNDFIDGAGGDDGLSGNAGNDVILGGAGNDYIVDDAGNDSLYGGDGHDYLNPGAGNDLLVGGRGDDYLDARDGVIGNDTVYGGNQDRTGAEGFDRSFIDFGANPIKWGWDVENDVDQSNFEILFDPGVQVYPA
jgi:Ca2+-binding RTX toxin-like protein